MNLALNFLVFALFTWWFWDRVLLHRQKLFVGIQFLFVIASIAVFLVSLYLQNDYLDGVHYLIAGGASTILFWIISMAMIIWKNLQEKNDQRMLPDILQSITLLLIPFTIWLLMSQMTFKIGG